MHFLATANARQGDESRVSANMVCPNYTALAVGQPSRSGAMLLMGLSHNLNEIAEVTVLLAATTRLTTA